MSNERIVTIPVRTQDYTSVQYGDNRIDAYLTLPETGISSETGALLLIHGWGNDGQIAYADESIAYADRFNLAVVRVEYRHSGREARLPVPGRTFERPYDFSKLQTIDAMRCLWGVLQRYPDLDRRRLLLWGGSQGAHIAAQSLIFAPEWWAGAVLCSGLYHPMTRAETNAGGFADDLRAYPEDGFIEYALGPGLDYPAAHEREIRSSLRQAHLISDQTPVTIIHGTREDNVDIRHATLLYARLLAHRKQAAFYAISGGDHGLAGAEADDESSRYAATLKYASDLLANRRRSTIPDLTRLCAPLPVTGGVYQLNATDDGPELLFVPE